MILKMLLTEEVVLSKIKELEKEGYVWKPLGGNANNEGLIQMLTDPGAGLTERITNAIDAVLEKYYSILQSDAKSPINLANEIKNNFSKNGKTDLEKLINVSIYNSESQKIDKSISIEIKDRGIGINGNDFEKTILRLSGDNKLTKKYLMGSYGQGGSTSVKFNEFTVIYSKKENQKETMTIIRYNQGTSEMKNGSYEYIVKIVNNNSYFAPSSVLEKSGTKIINVAMHYNKQIPTYKDPYKKIYKILKNRLFYPPLPFLLIDKSNENIKKKLIIGARRELNKKIKFSEYFDEKEIVTNQNSKIFLRWWFIAPEKNDLSKKFVSSCLKDARLPFNFTINGQTHGYESNVLLDEVGLSFLKKYFVCEVDLTNITKQERRLISSSSRESISKENSLWEEIKSKIIKYFLSCKKLKLINKGMKERMTNFEHNDKTFNQKLKKVLNDFVKPIPESHNLSSKENGQVDVNKIETSQQDEINLKDQPSYFYFKGLRPLKFSNDILKIRYITDGKPSVILKGMKIISIDKSLKLINKKQNGINGTILFDAKNTPINKNLIISFNIMQGLFIKKITVCKIEILNKKKKPGYPKTKIFFINKVNDKNYNRLDFNEQKPCGIEYSKIKNDLSIYINLANYPHLINYLKEPKILENFRNYYSIGLSLYIITQIQKNDLENSDIDENYNYNPIAKSLIWSFKSIN